MCPNTHHSGVRVPVILYYMCVQLGKYATVTSSEIIGCDPDDHCGPSSSASNTNVRFCGPYVTPMSFTMTSQTIDTCSLAKDNSKTSLNPLSLSVKASPKRSNEDSNDISDEAALKSPKRIKVTGNDGSTILSVPASSNEQDSTVTSGAESISSITSPPKDIVEADLSSNDSASSSQGATFSSTAAKKELSAMLQSHQDTAKVSNVKGGDNVRQHARKLCSQVDSAFALVCAPMVDMIDNPHDIKTSGGIDGVMANACMFYSLAVKSLQLLEPASVSDDVFSELTETYLCPRHLEDQASAVTSRRRDGVVGVGSSCTWTSLSLLFFMSLVVYARLHKQLSTSAASRRLMKSVEVCCKHHPSQTVTFVLLPCMLPSPSLLHTFLENKSAEGNIVPKAGTKKHLYELVNRVIRQVLKSFAIFLIHEAFFLNVCSMYIFLCRGFYLHLLLTSSSKASLFCHTARNK